MTAGGKSIGRGRVRSGDAQKTYTISLPAGNGGELTTRTSASIGTATMDSASHTISTGQDVDIHWTVGGVTGARYGVTVGTVAGTSVPFTGGAGDDLPIVNSGLTITARTSAAAALDGDQAQLVGVEFQRDVDTDTAGGHAEFVDTGAANVAALSLKPNLAYIYDIAGGDTNPFTGNPITDVLASNGSPTNDATLVILSVENITTTTTAAP